MPPDPVLIYHITHLENLTGILRDGCLYCHQQLRKASLHPVNIAYAGIQDRRAVTHVRCGPGGNLHNYIPFYFAPRSPMLYAIHKNQVEGYKDGQIPIVHLVSSVTQIQKTNHQFVFTDGHATMNFTRFFTEISDLDQVDWSLMRETYWHDTPPHLDRKRRRQAEFLVYNQVGFSAFIGIGVINQQIQQRIEVTLAAHQIKLPVVVRQNWYY